MSQINYERFAKEEKKTGTEQPPSIPKDNKNVTKPLPASPLSVGMSGLAGLNLSRRGSWSQSSFSGPGADANSRKNSLAEDEVTFVAFNLSTSCTRSCVKIFRECRELFSSHPFLVTMALTHLDPCKLTNTSISPQIKKFCDYLTEGDMIF